MKQLRHAVLLFAVFLSGCAEPDDVRSAEVYWIQLPASVGVGQAFQLRAALSDLRCFESGELVMQQHIDDAVQVSATWTQYEHHEADCFGGPRSFWVSVEIPGLPGPVGRTMDVRVAGKTYGRVTIADSGTSGMIAGGLAVFFQDTQGCHRVTPLAVGWIPDSYALDAPPPILPSPNYGAYVTGSFAFVDPPVCGDTVVYRVATADDVP